jgi:hypothetical protein
MSLFLQAVFGNRDNCLITFINWLVPIWHDDCHLKMLLFYLALRCHFVF